MSVIDNAVYVDGKRAAAPDSVDSAVEALQGCRADHGGEAPAFCWIGMLRPGVDEIHQVAAEFGLHESLPIYSGGLGVLAGDHCKSASDLGLPFTAVGMLFHQGYFRQLFNKEGWQEEAYDELDLTTLPIRPARTPSGDEARVGVRIGDRDIHVRVWELAVGRIQVLLEQLQGDFVA